MTPAYPKLLLMERSLSDHPWVFRRSVKPLGAIENGCVADLVAKDGTFLARGLYNGHARVGLRILTRSAQCAIDPGFFRDRLLGALDFRTAVAPEIIASGHYRLINSEGDHLSGLTIDIYGKLAVCQLYSKGYLPFRGDIEGLLRDLVRVDRVVWFAEKRAQKQEAFDLHATAPAAVDIREGGVTFQVSTDQMHKSGFYLDQRDNRQMFAKLSQDKVVADVCCFAACFGITAKVNGGAKEVVCVDLDPDAIALGRENAERAGAAIEFVTGNARDWALEEHNRGRFDLVVLDPPNMTKSKRDLDAALRRYVHLNASVMQTIKPGGILTSCSCTGLVSEDMFQKALRRAAQLAGRSLRVWNITGASADHPFAINSPEGRYLKVIWAALD